MRKKIIAGNWKMFKTVPEAEALANGIKNELQNKKIVLAAHHEVVVAPHFIALVPVAGQIKGSKIGLSAQNLYFEKEGAFTGEVSAAMIKSAGCTYVIIGHSERRTYFKETDEVLNKKIKAALGEGLKVIFCIGETRKEREENITFSVIERQVKDGLQGISESQMSSIVIAYEPVWAIGTGLTATPAQAQEVHAYIRSQLGKLFSPKVAEATTIQYGGSVNAGTIESLMGQKDIDGALVGGASLKADSFVEIIQKGLK